jgi:integrase/recombinase XerD
VTTPPDPSTALVPVSETSSALALPDMVRRAGQAAVFAADEFFYGAIRNEHTRAAYRRAVNQFLAWCEQRGLELPRIAPGDVGQYFDGLRKKNLSIATRKQHLAAVRHFFDGMVTRHAVILNPALSVRGERYEVIEGKTPEITVPQARSLLKDIQTARKIKRGNGAEEEKPCLVGLRDRALLAILAYTSSRAGAAAKLRRGDFYDAGEQWMLRFEEKGGKSREIPVRHDLQQMIAAYIEAAGLQQAPKKTRVGSSSMAT